MKLYRGDKVTLMVGWNETGMPSYSRGDTLVVDKQTSDECYDILGSGGLGFHIDWVQPCLYVYRDAKHCPEHRLWAEVCLGEPVHTADLPQRIRDLLLGGTFATMSDTVLKIIGWMVRRGEIKLPFTMVYVNGDGKESEHHMATDGDWVGYESVSEAGFYYLFSKGSDDA